MISKYEFGQLIEKLEKAVKFYKETNYKFNENKIYLSNGKTLEFMFKPQNIPHLLGIDVAYLRKINLLKANKPFDMLEELIERYDIIYKKIESGQIYYYNIFSPYIEKKISSFVTVLKCNIENTFFVSEYVLHRTYLNGQQNNYGCQYYIAFKEKSKLIFLGLKKQDDDYYYSPSSIICAFDVATKENILEALIKNQRIMLINCINIKNIGISNYLKNNKKLNLLQELVVLANKYDGHLIVYNDFIHTLKKLLNLVNQECITKNFISQLTLAINNEDKIDMLAFFDESSQELVQAYNILIQKLKQINEKDELIRLKQELLESQQQIKSQLKINTKKLNNN